MTNKEILKEFHACACMMIDHGHDLMDSLPQLHNLEDVGMPPFTEEAGQRMLERFKKAQQECWEVMIDLDRAYKMKAGNRPDTN